MIRYTPHMSHTNRKSNAKRKDRQGKAYKEKSQNRKIYRVVLDLGKIQMIQD